MSSPENDKNIQKIKLLEHNSRTKDAFLASMSHEIRTPLNGIIGMTDVLCRTKLDSTQKEYINIIKNCSNQLLDLINDVLDFSKIIAGKLTLFKEKFELLKCIEESFDTISARADAKKLELSYMIDDDVPTFLNSDKKRLRQVIVNILSNAVKFTEKGSIILHVSAYQQVNDKYNIIFKITDTGKGIPEDKLESIFDRFTQVESADDTVKKGTGLGLSICRHIVEIFDGKIYADSILGEGSTFTFNMITEGNNDVQSTRNVDVLEGKTVLLVDDNMTNRVIYFNLLNKWKLKVTMCSSGEEALLFVKNYTYDIILLDIHMPDINGVKLAELIRNSNVQSYIIALSSLSELDEDNNLFDFKLVKPVKQEKLLNTLLQLYRKKSTRRSDHGSKLNIKVLVAEDNHYNRIVTQELLISCGVRSENLKIVNNGKEVINVLEEEPDTYDILFLDIEMPVLNGYQVYDYICKKKINIQTIALTAHSSDVEKDKCMSIYGMNGFLCKPVTFMCLKKILMNFGK